LEERIYIKQRATKDSLQIRLQFEEIQNKYKVEEEKLRNARWVILTRRHLASKKNDFFIESGFGCEKIYLDFKLISEQRISPWVGSIPM